MTAASRPSVDDVPSMVAEDAPPPSADRTAMTAKEAVVTTVASGAIAAAVLQWVIPICLVC